MSFTINQELCVECGGCFSNCPNGAVLKSSGVYSVSAMCSDCGTCVSCCPVGAIGPGVTKTDFDNMKIDSALKEKLSLQRDIVAMKFSDNTPDGIPIEEGPQFWCAICGDIFEGNGDPIYFSGRASACGGSTMVGVGAPQSDTEEFKAAMDAFVVGEGKLFISNELISRGREFFPLFSRQFKGVILGSLQQMSMPDMIYFPVTPHQMAVLSTAYAFETGNVISGYSGAPMCIQTIPVPFLQNKPAFNTGDWGGRTRSRLKEEEMLVSLPYKLVPGFLSNLDRISYAHER